MKTERCDLLTLFFQRFICFYQHFYPCTPFRTDSDTLIVDSLLLVIIRKCEVKSQIAFWILPFSNHKHLLLSYFPSLIISVFSINQKWNPRFCGVSFVSLALWSLLFFLHMAQKLMTWAWNLEVRIFMLILCPYLCFICKVTILSLIFCRSKSYKVSWIFFFRT